MVAGGEVSLLLPIEIPLGHLALLRRKCSLGTIQFTLHLMRTRPGEDVLRNQALLGQIDDTTTLCGQHASGQLHRWQDSRLQVLIQATRR